MFMSIGLQRESSSKGRRKWTEEEVQAVEKMLKTFIISRKVPGKQDCESYTGKQQLYDGGGERELLLTTLKIITALSLNSTLHQHLLDFLA
ncbi:hypothetical protein N1851_002405 [Merluccius polli]|uniref:Uncharacterized protein n=1 Tax=Merluccius polli TaxID=89951 RepID=A0AA47P8Q6_MERPO|nr:hypothetical protein N1851_002405 [Merluccius polli]